METVIKYISLTNTSVLRLVFRKEIVCVDTGLQEDTGLEQRLPFGAQP